MKIIGFVDYYLSEWHANNYVGWLKEASEKLGITLSEISVCTRLHHKSAGGYKWRYVNERNQMA